MDDALQELATYLHLVRASGQRRRPLVRDRLLVISGVAATRMGLNQIAALCRRQVLDHNPQHLIGRYPSFAQALGDRAFQTFFRQLHRRYPREKAERMLQALGIDLAREWATYGSAAEYAAALLGAGADFGAPSADDT